MDLKKQKIIFDTDLGDDIDDAYALSLLLCEKKSEIVGVTTVYRNAWQRAKIASRMIRLFGENIPVYIGEDFPEKQPLKSFEKAQKDERGIWGIPHYAPEMAEEKTEDIHAVDFILDTLNRYPNEIVLVAVGPLTNLAKAYEKSPEIFKKAKSILIMGGNYAEQSPEWNIECDPEAAKTVYSAGVPLKAVGIDVTRKCNFFEKELSVLRSLNSEKFKLLVKMTEIWINHNKERGIAPTMHDPLTVGELFHSVCSFEKGKVFVETEGEKRGCTLFGENGAEIEYATGANYAAFISHLLSLIQKADA